MSLATARVRPKGFGDPGSTQERVEGGRFGPAEAEGQSYDVAVHVDGLPVTESALHTYTVVADSAVSAALQAQTQAREENQGRRVTILNATETPKPEPSYHDEAAARREEGIRYLARELGRPAGEAEGRLGRARARHHRGNAIRHSRR